MLIVYVTCRVDADLVEFDRWISGHVELTRRVPGCAVFDVWRDAADPHRLAIVEAWSDRASRDRYLVMPHHVEMVALGSTRWGMHDFVTQCWPDAGDSTTSSRQLAHELSGDRPVMRQLVDDYLRGTHELSTTSERQ